MADVFDDGSYTLLSPKARLLPTRFYAANLYPGLSAAVPYLLSGGDPQVPSVQPYILTGTNAAATAASNYIAANLWRQASANATYLLLSTKYPPYVHLSLGRGFVEERFPESVSFGSSGGPGFQTSVFRVDSGIETAMSNWDQLRARYSVKFSFVPKEDIDVVENFFYAMRGRAVGFRYKDWNDYQIVNQNVLIGDGITTGFQLFKRYRSGPVSYDRPITKPVQGSITTLQMNDVTMHVDSDFYVNHTTGMITFNEAPAPGALGMLPYGEFDVPVRFDTDQLTVSAEEHNQYSISSLEMIEIAQ